MDAPIRGPWDLARVERHLRETVIPLRLAAQLQGGDGFPVVLSLWFRWHEAALWCAVQADSRIADHLRADPRCAFEVAADQPPYKGVRGQARAEIVAARGEETLRALLGRYQGGTEGDLARWLLSRADSEVAIKLTPVRFYTWDFSDRMREGP